MGVDKASRSSTCPRSSSVPTARSTSTLPGRRGALLFVDLGRLPQDPPVRGRGRLLQGHDPHLPQGGAVGGDQLRYLRAVQTRGRRIKKHLPKKKKKKKKKS